MKNIINSALVAAMVLSLAACDPKHKGNNNGPDSTSTTVIDSNSSTKTTTVIDSTKTDTVKVAAQKAHGKRSGGSDGGSSMQAVRDSFKKDSAKMSRK